MKILIRTDGGYRIGMGHVMRMLVLAGTLREFADVVFACRDNEEFQTGIRHIEACGYSILRIDGKRVVGELERIGGDCLITDSYDVDENYFDSTRNIFGITGYMDDLNKHRINANFIINQNIYADDLKYKAGMGTILFSGTQYLLLREEFQKLPRRIIRDRIQNVLITLGGADPKNLTEMITLKVSRAFPEIRFHIAAGPSFTHKASLLKIEKENILLYDDPKMSELMLKCDAAISACGSTAYELCACGTPFVGVVTADNQIMAARKMNAIGVLKYAEEPDELIKHLRSLDFGTRVKMSKTGQGLVDGYGSIRLARELKKIIGNTLLRGD